MKCGLKAAYECIDVFSATDLGADLARIDVPMLIVHGEEDQIVPIANSAHKAAQDRQGCDAQGLCRARRTACRRRHKAELNADLLAFITEVREPAPTATKREDRRDAGRRR